MGKTCECDILQSTKFNGHQDCREKVLYSIMFMENSTQTTTRCYLVLITWAFGQITITISSIGPMTSQQ